MNIPMNAYSTGPRERRSALRLYQGSRADG
jgi:hypothetical protein